MGYENGWWRGTLEAMVFRGAEFSCLQIIKIYHYLKDFISSEEYVIHFCFDAQQEHTAPCKINACHLIRSSNIFHLHWSVTCDYCQLFVLLFGSSWFSMHFSFFNLGSFHLQDYGGLRRLVSYMSTCHCINILIT